MIDPYLKYLQFEKRYSPQTVVSYATDLHQFEKYLQTEFPETLIEQANYGLVRSWIVRLVEKKIGTSSINRKIACLRSFYKFLLRQEIISKDPSTESTENIVSQLVYLDLLISIGDATLTSIEV